MLDALGTILATTAIAVGLVAFFTAAPLRMSWRLGLAAGAGVWIGVAAAIAGSGALERLPILLAVFTLPLAAAAGVTLISAAARAFLLALPLPLLIGLNLFRVGGLLFVLLATVGRLAGPFPYFAGLGDFATGLFAIPVALLAARGPADGRRRIATWNAFGTLDLVLAIALGITSRPGSALQLIHAGVGSAAMTSLPWALVPTVLVPFFLLVHAIVFARLRGCASDKLSTCPMPPEGLGVAG
ncbi:MAG TPA: hypothetical protein VM755_06555 [Stellaceae bacterium]|nr:hypothetical protein [Stellaceae bacterium]